MLREVLGIEKIQRLYIQLLYNCNFRCKHCFLGDEFLNSHEKFDLNIIKNIINKTFHNYQVESVVLLGGEPFLFSQIAEVTHYCKNLGLNVEICSNGYKIQEKLQDISQNIDLLRVSLEGLEEINDYIRHPGSYKAALQTLNCAMDMGIKTAVTVTINAVNINDVIILAEELIKFNIDHLKLHHIRYIGYASKYNDFILKKDMIEKFHKEFSDISLRIPYEIICDDDLFPNNNHKEELLSNSGPIRSIERVEVQPNGNVYLSCKAVGTNLNAFVVDRNSGEIVYKPKEDNELCSNTPQVNYKIINSK